MNLAKISLITVLIFSVQLIQAQHPENFKEYKGVVKDQNSNAEIVFGTVSVIGTNIGTVTNSDGEFSIKILDSNNASEIEFSHIGYNSKKIKITGLKENEDNEIYLEASSINLAEITIRPENAKELMKKVLRKIPENYSENTLKSVGFYRETIKQRRSYLAISEALVDVYKAPYSSSADDRVKVYKGRKGNDVKKADTLAVKLQGGPYTTLLFDVAKNPFILLNTDVFPYYSFKIKNMKNIDGKLNYVVEFKPSGYIQDYPMYVGKYYIEVESLAITSAEFSLDIRDKQEASQMFVKKKPMGLKLTPTDTHYLVTYKEIGGKYYFKYSRGEFEFRCNWKKRLFNSNYRVTSEMAITNWTKDKAEKLRYRDALKKNTVFEDELSAFIDEDFWGEHNVIEPTNSIEKALKKYSKKLEK